MLPQEEIFCLEIIVGGTGATQLTYGQAVDRTMKKVTSVRTLSSNGFNGGKCPQRSMNEDSRHQIFKAIVKTFQGTQKVPAPRAGGLDE